MAAEAQRLLLPAVGPDLECLSRQVTHSAVGASRCADPATELVCNDDAGNHDGADRRGLLLVDDGDGVLAPVLADALPSVAIAGAATEPPALQPLPDGFLRASADVLELRLPGEAPVRRI